MIRKQGAEQVIEMLTAKLDENMVVPLDDVSWEDAGNELRWAILAKLASGRPIRKGVLINLFEKVWRLKQPAEFYKAEKNILLVKFSNNEDQEKLLQGGPWTLEGEAILFQKWELGMTGDAFDNTRINTWIHVQGLPYEPRRTDFAKKLRKLCWAGEKDYKE